MALERQKPWSALKGTFCHERSFFSRILTMLILTMCILVMWILVMWILTMLCNGWLPIILDRPQHGTSYGRGLIWQCFWWLFYKSYVPLQDSVINCWKNDHPKGRPPRKNARSIGHCQNWGRVDPLPKMTLPLFIFEQIAQILCRGEVFPKVIHEKGGMFEYFKSNSQVNNYKRGSNICGNNRWNTVSFTADDFVERRRQLSKLWHWRQWCQCWCHLDWWHLKYSR